MNKFASLAFVATLTLFSLVPAALHAETVQAVDAATEAAPPVSAVAGKILYTANGNRVAPIYRVSATGRVQVILNGKLITVPNSTLSDVNGKVTTSLSKAELQRAR